LTCISARFENLAVFTDAIGEIRKSVNHEVVKDQKKTRLVSYMEILWITKK
jgi:hypothetical protein